MANKLEGKIAVIAGGGSDIGLTTAKRLVLEGACVFIIDRHKRDLKMSWVLRGTYLADLDKLYNIVKDDEVL